MILVKKFLKSDQNCRRYVRLKKKQLFLKTATNIQCSTKKGLKIIVLGSVRLRRIRLATLWPVHWLCSDWTSLLLVLKQRTQSWHTVETTRIKPFSTYVCTEQTFDSPPFMCKIMFLKNLLYKMVAHNSTLFLAPFMSKLINYSRHSETLNLGRIQKSTTFSF